MRKQYQKILKKHFHKYLIETMNSKKYSSSQMAEQLAMDIRSFADLSGGKSSCSAITLTLFMIYYCENPTRFFAELRDKFENEKEMT